jgi:hypothetical protein
MLGLDSAKTNALAELLRDIGSIFFASLFIGPFITKDLSFWFAFPGIMLAGFAWFLGVKIVKE